MVPTNQQLITQTLLTESSWSPEPCCRDSRIGRCCVCKIAEGVCPEGYNSHYDFNIFSKGNASDLTRNRDLQGLDVFNIMIQVGRT